MLEDHSGQGSELVCRTGEQELPVLSPHLTQYLESSVSFITNLRSVLYLETRKPLLHRLGSLIRGQDPAPGPGERPRQLGEVGLLGL